VSEGRCPHGARIIVALRALDWIERLTEPRGPTVRELGQALGLRSSCTVQHHADALRRKGLLRPTARRSLNAGAKARALSLTEAGREALARWRERHGG
jgi:SOS-response transcriptional repressor LexA